jgi:hypothetical protein
VRLHEVDKAKEICKDVYTTGELGELVKEQSSIMKTCNGLTVITGCAHPSLENILSLASDSRKYMGCWRLPRIQQTRDIERSTFNSFMSLHSVGKRVFNLYPKFLLEGVFPALMATNPAFL